MRENTCGECKQIIDGTMYVTEDGYILCVNCWYREKEK